MCVFLFHINDNKIHGIHHFMNQIQSRHDFVYGIVRGLPSANHDGTLTQGCLGDPMGELPNDKGNTLIHQPIQIGRDTGHLRHHANLQNQTKQLSQCQGHEKKKAKNKITHRHPVIQHAMAMVAPIGPGDMQSHDHLVPSQAFA